MSGYIEESELSSFFQNSLLPEILSRQEKPTAKVCVGTEFLFHDLITFMKFILIAKYHNNYFTIFGLLLLQNISSLFVYIYFIRVPSLLKITEHLGVVRVEEEFPSSNLPTTTLQRASKQKAIESLRRIVWMNGSSRTKT
jgi:hypothetical protein